MYSNCLLESIKQYIKHPKEIKIRQKGSWLGIFKYKYKFPHFYWLDLRDNKHYHFYAKYSDESFLYQGEIKRFLEKGI